MYGAVSYALHDLPMTLTHIKKVHAAVMKHLRAISNTPVHITKISDVALLESLNMASPLEMIQKQSAQAYQEMEKFGTEGGIAPQGWLCRMHEHYQQLQAEVTAMRDQKERPVSQTEPVVPENAWTCHVCSKSFTSNKGLKIHLSKAHHLEKPTQVFIPSQHASDGLPQCKFCSKKFANWKIMRDHIQQGWCENFRTTNVQTAIPQETSHDQQHDITTSIGDAALCNDPAIQSMVRMGLHAFLRNHELLQKLKQHCVLCNQWMAGERPMKTHYQHMHASFLKEHQQDIQLWMKRTGQAFSPCIYCANHVIQSRGHIPKCTVLFQLGALFVPARKVQYGRGDPGHVRQRGYDASGRDNYSGSRGHPQGSQAAQECELGERQGAQSSRTQNFQRRPRGHSCHLGQDGVESGGRDQDPQTKLQSGSVLETRGALNPAPDAQHGHQMERRDESQTRRQDHSFAHGHANTSHPRGDHQARSTTGSTRNETEPGQAWMAGPRTWMDFPNMEPCQEGVGRGHQPPSYDGRRPSASVDQNEGQPPGGHHLAFPQYSTHHLTDGESGHISAGNLSKNTGIQSGMGCIPAPHGQHRIPDHRAPVQERRLEAISAGNESTRMAKPVTRLILLNHSNHCYVNATVKCLLWTILMCNSSQVKKFGLGEISLQHILRNSGTPTHIMSILTWKVLLSSWSRAHQQHDASEFSSFLCDRLRLPDFRGEWVARRVQNTFVWKTDQGSTAQAIFLEVPPPPPGLQGVRPIHVQNLINMWESQSSIHALRRAPNIICLQLGRFLHDNAQGYKDMQPVEFSGLVCVTMFTGNDLHRSLVKYRVHAGVMHHGDLPTTGHYTAFLSAGESHLLCDDGQCAIAMQVLPDWVPRTLSLSTCFMPSRSINDCSKPSLLGHT